MAESDEDPSPWELLRSIRAVGASVEKVADAMLTKDRFDEYQRGTDRRFEQNENRQVQWEAKSERAHGELDGKIAAVQAAGDAKIKAVEKAAEEREEKAREARGRVWLAIATTVLVVIAPRVWEVLQGTGTAP